MVNIFIYMGFGNGLCVDKTIYQEYEPYLLDEVERMKEKNKEAEVKSYMYYSSWKVALEIMLNNKKNKLMEKIKEKER